MGQGEDQEKRRANKWERNQQKKENTYKLI